MDAAGVGAAGLDDIHLGVDAPLLGQDLQLGDHLGVADHGGVHDLDGGAAAQLAAAGMLGAQLVGGHRHVHHHGVVGVDGVGRRFCPPKPQFLLSGKDKIEVIAAVLETLHSQEEGQAGNAVVHIGRDEPVAGGIGWGVVDGGVPDADHGPGLVGVVSADVDIEVVQGHVLRLHRLAEADDAPDAVLEPDGGGDKVGGVEPSHLAEAEEALLLDVGDDAADGIHMGGKHHPGAAPLLVGDEVAHGVPAAFIHEGHGQLFQHVGHLGLVAGGAVTGVEGLEGLQKIDHGLLLLSVRGRQGFDKVFDQGVYVHQILTAGHAGRRVQIPDRRGDRRHPDPVLGALNGGGIVPA